MKNSSKVVIEQTHLVNWTIEFYDNKLASMLGFSAVPKAGLLNERYIAQKKVNLQPELNVTIRSDALGGLLLPNAFVSSRYNSSSGIIANIPINADYGSMINFERYSEPSSFLACKDSTPIGQIDIHYFSATTFFFLTSTFLVN